MANSIAIYAVIILAQAQATLDYHKQLDGAARMPVVVSPDGTQVLFFQLAVEDPEGDSKTSYTYRLADLDGENQRTVFETPVEWDDLLNTVTTPATFSPDGKRIVVATTDNGKPMRDRENPGRAVPAVCEVEGGNPVTIKTSRGSCGGFGFAGKHLVVLDTPGIINGEGYHLRLYEGGWTENDSRIVHSDEKVAASCLRVSPDGREVAFFISGHVTSSLVQIRFVNLETGKFHDTVEFRSQSATFDGRPQLFWDRSGKGMFCHVSTHPQGKWPFELTYYDAGLKKGRFVTPQRNIGASTVLDERYIALWHPDAAGCSVFDQRNEQSYRLPTYNYILGGRGRNVVIADLEREAVYAATVRLIAPANQAQTDNP